MIKKNLKVIIGLIVIAPFFQGVLMLLFLLSGESNKFINNPDYEFTSIYKLMVDLAAPTVFIILLVMLINLICLYTSGKVPVKKRSLWSGLIVVGNVWVAPFFWYWYIWKKRPGDPMKRIYH